MRKIGTLLRDAVLWLWVWLMTACPALAQQQGQGGGQDFGPVATKDAGELATKIGDLVEKVGMPVGGAVLFLSVCVVAIELMLTRGNPQKRAEAMSGILYVAIGGVLLGGAMFFAGVFLGAGRNVFGQ